MLCAFLILCLGADECRVRDGAEVTLAAFCPREFASVHSDDPEVWIRLERVRRAVTIRDVDRLFVRYPQATRMGWPGDGSYEYDVIVSVHGWPYEFSFTWDTVYEGENTSVVPDEYSHRMRTRNALIHYYLRTGDAWPLWLATWRDPW